MPRRTDGRLTLTEAAVLALLGMPPFVLFSVFLAYGLSGYAVYVRKRMKGRPVSVIATSTDEPDEKRVPHHDRREHHCDVEHVAGHRARDVLE